MKIFYPLIVFTFATFAGLTKEVSIEVEGKVLAGEILVAKEGGSRVVLMIAGSGATDRDGNTIAAGARNDCLKLLAEGLEEKGVTNLRIDKRGVGASAKAMIKEEDLRLFTYVEDVRHWIKFLKQQGYSEIVLLGNSEGALVASLAATSKSVEKLVCVAGIGRPFMTVLREQLKKNLPGDLYKKADKLMRSLEAGEMVKEVPVELSAFFRPSVQPYLISCCKIDPAKALAKLKVPILIIQGSTDLQTSMEDAVLLHTAAQDGQLLKVEGMNHVLKKVDGDLAGQWPSYVNPNLPLHEDLVRNVVLFLRKE